MKKLYLLIIALIVFTGVDAQISDNAAKLQYQQAEDAYNNSKYFTAANRAIDLSDNMKGWTPKVLYLYLKSAYKNYAEPAPGDTLFSKSYDNFKTLSDKCDQFFKITNKATYPPDKYNEVAAIQHYFQQMQSQFAYQTSRTAASAVGFLNDCAGKFPGDVAAGTGSGGIPNGKIVVSLQGSRLKLITMMIADWGNGNDRIEYQVDVIDFSKVTGIYKTERRDEHNQMKNDYFLKGSGQQASKDYYYTTKNAIVVARDINKQKAKYREYDIRNMDKLKADTSGFNLNGQADKDFKIFDFFNNNTNGYYNKNNTAFFEGDYENRIKEAFQYLIDYFPKAATRIEEKAIIKRPTGF